MIISKYLRSYYFQLQNIHRWDFVPAETNLIVSLTTVPSRIKWLKPTLISLLRQKPDAVELNLARSPLKEDVEWELPDWLTSLSAVRIYWLDDDYGPASKFIPTLERHQSDNPLIVVVDDDMYYPGDLLSNLAEASRKSDGEVAYCASGHKIKRNLRFFESPSNPDNADGYQRVAIIEGCGGYAIRPGFFDIPQLKRIDELAVNCRKQDDIWISGCLSQRGIAKYQVATMRRKGLIKTLMAAITGDRVEASDAMLAHFADAWRDEEFDD